jgi:Domain of unknown function DUF302
MRRGSRGRPAAAADWPPDLRQRQGRHAYEQSTQSIGIDLPLKIPVWQDADGVTWLSYNDPGWFTHRHGLDDSTKAAVDAMTSALNAIAAKATNHWRPAAGPAGGPIGDGKIVIDIAE